LSSRDPSRRGWLDDTSPRNLGRRRRGHSLFLYPGFPIPPRRVVNQLLGEGEFIAGMSGGCVCPPTVLDEAAYEALVSELLERSDRTRYAVQTLEDYRFWGRELAWGVPAAENRDYVQGLHDWVKRDRGSAAR
jgi:hypothetical protein